METQKKERVELIKNKIDQNIQMMENLRENKVIYPSEEQRMYKFFDKRISNDTFSKIFEMKSQPDWLYILTHNNKQVAMSNMMNPYLGEITISRVNKTSYLNQENDKELFEDLKSRLPQICLHEFIPGTVQKIALDQVFNQNVAIIYRILRDNGWIQRARLYNISSLDCGKS